jgi:ELWxxDGT repeat protein
LLLLVSFPLSAWAAPVPFLVKDINPSPGVGSMDAQRALGTLGDHVFFSANNGVNGSDFWKSDGTPEGTAPVSNTRLAVTGDFADAGNILYFVGNDYLTSNWGPQICLTDGTAEGTRVLNNGVWAERYSAPANLMSFGAGVVFLANDSAHGYELWKTDGTGAGTQIVVDLYPGPEESSLEQIVMDGTLYLSGNSGICGPTCLWKSDGTPVGTQFVTEKGGGHLVVLNHELYFAHSEPETRQELWKSDGTEAGTVMVKDINQQTGDYAFGSSTPAQFTVSGEMLYFVATDGIHGGELWRTDGTEAGTVMVKDVDPRQPVSFFQGIGNPLDLTDVNGKLFFTADDGVHDRELWVTDGTEEGTIMLTDLDGAIDEKPIRLFNCYGTLYVTAYDSAHGGELWKSDGTPQGTVLVADIRPGSSGSVPSYKAAANGLLFFSAIDGVTGRELWALNIAPVAESLEPAGPLLTHASTVDFTVTFSEAVTGVDISDFVVLAEGVSGAAVMGVSGLSGDPSKVWTVTVATGTGDGALGLKLVDDDSIVDTMDPLPLEGLGTPVGDFTCPDRYTLDRTPPAAALSSAAPEPIGLDPIPVTAYFTEPVHDFALDDVAVTNGAAMDFTGSGHGYAFSVLPVGPGPVTVRIPADSAHDAAGNGNTASNVLARTVLAPEGEGPAEGEGNQEEGEGQPGEGEGEGAIPEGEGAGEGGGEGEGEGEGGEPAWLMFYRDAPAGYTPGQSLEIRVRCGLSDVSDFYLLVLDETLPPGWTYSGVTAGAVPTGGPALGASGPLEFTWYGPPYPTIADGMTYAVQIPEDAHGSATFSGILTGYTLSGLITLDPVVTLVPQAPATEGEGFPEGLPEGEGVPEGVEEGDGAAEGDGATEGLAEGEGLPEGLPEGEGQPPAVHSADQNGDGAINLTELLRVIEFFNLRGLHCAIPPASTEDGYAPGPGGDQSCSPHASDYNPRNWQINLSELLRIIQFYNMRGYHACLGQGTEDGYCPGAG